MKTLKDQHFWPSYVDLMTSLFFIAFVLFIISFTIQQKIIGITEGQLKRIEEIKNTVESLIKKDTEDLFIYEERYKRYRIAQRIKFRTGQSEISPNKIENYSETVAKLEEIGNKLNNVINTLKSKKDSDSTFANVSYLMIIAGRASNDNFSRNYELSYERALSLYNFWKGNGIDFDSEAYNDIIDLQISGNGTGGIGRDSVETNNQCFLIQIVPKISTDNVEASSLTEIY